MPWIVRHQRLASLVWITVIVLIGVAVTVLVQRSQTAQLVALGSSLVLAFGGHLYFLARRLAWEESERGSRRS